jgi:hypothetical protein
MIDRTTAGAECFWDAEALQMPRFLMLVRIPLHLEESSCGCKYIRGGKQWIGGDGVSLW